MPPAGWTSCAKNPQSGARTSSALFIGKVLDVLAALGTSLEVTARGKYRLVEALVRAIAQHRAVRETQAYQRALLPQSGLEFATSADVGLTFDEDRYGYNQPYKGPIQFEKHFCRVVGDFEESGEEHECAIYLERPHEVTDLDSQHIKATAFLLAANLDRPLLSGLRMPFDRRAHSGRRIQRRRSQHSR